MQNGVGTDISPFYSFRFGGFGLLYCEGFREFLDAKGEGSGQKERNNELEILEKTYLTFEPMVQSPSVLPFWKPQNVSFKIGLI